MISNIDMLRIVLLVLTSMTIRSESFEVFENQPLQRLAGVYFESLSDLFIFRDHWKLITYVNLAPLENKEKLLNTYAEKIKKLCYSHSKSSNNITCSGLQELKRIQKKLVKLETDKENINDIIGFHEIHSNRKKRGARVERGAFNFVGKIQKILFGTLDEADADYFNAQIDRVDQNFGKLTNLYEKQISIMQSTINNVSDAFKKINEKFIEIDHNLFIIEHQMLEDITEYQTEIKMNTKVNSHLIECEAMLVEYELELKTLSDAILLARRGLLHPKILSARELFNNLKDLQMTANKRLPVAMKLSQFNNLIDCIDISVFCKNDKLVYILEIPLIEENTFILYRALPLPIKQNQENVYAFINPLHMYIGLDTDIRVYTHLTDRDIAKCKKINNGMICKQTDLFYQTFGIHNCESELLKSAKLENILKVCDVRLTKIHNTAWYQLQSANSWLYTAPHEETLHISCKDGKQHDTQLFSTGIIKLSPECNAISNDVILNSQATSRTLTINKDFIPNVNISIDKLDEDIRKNNVNISELHLLNISKTSHLNINSLKTASSSLHELYKEANEINKHHQTKVMYNKFLNWFYYTLYTITGLVATYITVKCSLTGVISVIKKKLGFCL